MPPAMGHATIHSIQVPNVLAMLLQSCKVDPYKLPQTESGFFRKAQFATISRLLTCLVNEQLADAYYVSKSNNTNKHALFVPAGSSLDHPYSNSIVSQLRHRPVTALASNSIYDDVSKVTFLDPEDIGLHQWICNSDFGDPSELNDPALLLKIVGGWCSIDNKILESIGKELSNSVENQAYKYAHRGNEPNIIASDSIEWEQSIIEGHATHPMHRARYAVAPLDPIDPSTDLFNIDLAFIAVPRNEIRVEGKFEELMAPLYSSATMESSADSEENKSQYILDFVDRSMEIVFPVHPLHVPAVLAKFNFARKLPFSAPAKGQASLRTVCPTAFESLGFDLKLPLGIKVSSALRTISPWSTYVGPRITSVIPEILSRAPVKDALIVSGEPASAVSKDKDFDIAKYLSCIIREDPEYICRQRNEKVILAAALTNFDKNGVSMAINQWNLNTLEKRCEFLRDYVGHLFDAFLPPVMNHTFAFESHPQNTLLRIDPTTGRIKGFIIRDFGGIKMHRESFRKSTGVFVDMLPDSFTDASSIHEVYDLAYHTLIQCQIHRLVHALNLHYSGEGWAIVREELEKRLPKDHPLHKSWYQENFDLKCFVTMKFDGLYRDYVYRKVPNVIFYRGEEEGVVLKSA